MAGDTQDHTQANISRVKELAWGLVSTAALVVAVDLRIAEALDAGARPAEDIAKEVGADPVALTQLLDALVARGVLTLTNGGRYAHTELSLLLRENDPNSVSYLVKWIGHPVFWRLWPHLGESIEVYCKDFFRYIHEEEPAAVTVFNRAMTQASNHTSEAVVTALRLDGATTVADIGGGQGRLIRTVLQRHPEVTGTLLDLEGVVAQALPELRPGGVFADRTTVLAGDCRREVPVTADVYVLKNILDWDDPSTIRTLENVRANARPGARVVVVETLTDYTPEPAVTTSLDLLLLLNVGGRKRPAEQVAELFARSGIRFQAVHPTGTFLTLVEGVVPA
jgi:C-methyltransferase